jgi:hypothetical protein
LAPLPWRSLFTALCPARADVAATITRRRLTTTHYHQGEQADWQPPDCEAFNVIPGRQFGYAMARMPL